MKTKFNILIIVFFFFFFIKVNAQEDLNTLLTIAAKNNPGLKAKYNKYLADMQKVPQVGSLPDPDVTFGYFITPMELVEGAQVGQIQFMQMFPWFGTLKAAKDEASTMALSSFELFRAEKEDLFLNVKKNYYQLYLAQKQIQVYDTTLVLLKSIEQLLLLKTSIISSGNTNPVSSETQTKSSNPVQGNSSMGGMNAKNQSASKPGMNSMNTSSMSGSSSAFSDLLRLQVEIKELEDNIASMNNRKQMLFIQINSLLNRNPNIEIYIPETLNFTSFNYQNATLYDSIKANNPMINMNKADILSYQQRQKMNKKMGYPMIGIGMNYMIIKKSEMNTSPMNTGMDMYMPMLTVKVPLYRKKYNASVKEAQYLENSSTEQLANVENMLYMEFSEYQFELKDAERKMSITNDIISLTKQSFDLLLTQYTTSGAEFDAIIRLHRQLLDYKLNIIQAQVNKLDAIAGIQKLLSVK